MVLRCKTFHPAHKRELYNFDAQWSATAIVDVVLTQQSSTSDPSRLPSLPPSSQHSFDIYAVAKEVCSLRRHSSAFQKAGEDAAALKASAFFQRLNHSRWTDL